MKKLLSDIMVELHVPSFEITKKFYKDLGFKVIWERKPKDTNTQYLVMRKGTSVINFYGGTDNVYNHSFFKEYPKNTIRGYAVEIIIPIDNLELFYKKISSKYPNNIVRHLEKKFSHPDFRIIDPFGFYIRFVERYDWVNGRDSKGNTIKNG